MKVAVFSDIHSNYHALYAVMTDAFDQENCTEVTCLGDIVGYNAFPGTCLDYIRQLNCPVVKGNHDAEVVNPVYEKMNDLAREAMEWTVRQLTDEQLQWLARLQYQRMVRPQGTRAASFTIVHSTLLIPTMRRAILTNNFLNFVFMVIPTCLRFMRGMEGMQRRTTISSIVWS